MIIIFAGPSGSGKTTIITKLMSICPQFKIINVDVDSGSCRNYEGTIGRRFVSKEYFEDNIKKKHYSAVNFYDLSKYGYCFPSKVELKKDTYILDYPGEYPECAELANLNWQGVLVLPPSKQVLERRLLIAGRQNRIESACAEFEECLKELENGEYKTWTVIINDSILEIDKKLISIFC